MNQSNLFVALALSLVILLGFHYFYEKPRQEAMRFQTSQQQNASLTAPITTTPLVAAKPRATLLAEAGRIALETPALRGSINLRGARLDDLTLTQYRETTDPASAPIVLLSPAGVAPPHHAYYASFGWLADNLKLPDDTTMWRAPAGARLTPATPLVLTWDNGQGLWFERRISVDEHFMFTITERISNKSGNVVTLHPFALIARQGKKESSELGVMHIGPMGVFDNVLQEHAYDDVMDEGTITATSTGGWLGITDKYWMVALVPAQGEGMTANFRHAAPPSGEAEAGRFQADYRGAPMSLAPGQEATATRHLFAGAKLVHVLDEYGAQLNIPRFDRAIDFGWFAFLTKPLLYVLDWLGRMLGNIGVAILVLTVFVKLLVLPLGVKSFRSMARLRQLQPEMQRIAERFKDDRARQSVEMMELYKREKVSPFSGCLPIVAQIPIFFALYKVLYVAIEMRHAPFFGWIHDLSAPDPTSLFNLFGLIPWDPPSFLHLGVWPLLMGVSMWLQQKLAPQPTDPIQAKMMMALPIVFTLMLGPTMAAGLIIYWTWSNLLSILQQMAIYRRMQVKI